MKAIHVILLSVAVIFGGRTSAAEPDSTTVRPVLSTWSYGVGASRHIDTYLSPLHYAGWGMQLSYERMQVLRYNPDHRLLRLYGQVDGGITLNPAHNARMRDLAFSFSCDLMHRWRLDGPWQLAVGPTAGLRTGVLYLPRNGNNPVAAHASVTVGVTGMAVCNVRLGRLPVTLRYLASMPLTGAFFSPDYGELYYEIYLGNHSGLAHVAWPGNFFRLDNLLTADLHLGTSNLRLGYRADFFSSKSSGIVTRRINHLFVIGVTTEWLSLRAGAPVKAAHVVSAMY